MNREEKQAVVAETSDLLARAQVVMLADFTGLDVAAVTELRRRCRHEGVVFKVVKNTLIKLAAEGTDAARLGDYLQGPNALVLGFEDAIAPAKVISGFAKGNPKLEIKAGVIGDRLLSAEDISTLARLPGREELLAMVLGTMNAVPQKMVLVLAAVIRRFLGTLEAVEEQKAAA
ncbi:MAG: 50S ribosomal protein L10 [Proteobacteria bacterium]|nr:50S ribosomal protein L10 [Pseudomonadota bacterium]